MAFSWSDVIGAALAWWQDQQKSSGGTPNFYPAPLTPEEKYWDDARKKTFEGSPTRDFITGLGTQFLGGLDTQPKNHSFLSDAMKGQTYGGGFVAPKFDLSKLPSLTGTSTGTPPGRPGGPNGPGVGGPGGRDIDPATGGGNPLNPVGGGGPFGPDPGGLDQLPTNIPKDGPDGGFADWFAEYRRKNPQWWKNGVTALISVAAGALGMPATVVAKLLKDYMTWNSPSGEPTGLPELVDRGDAIKKSPGTLPEGASPPWSGGGGKWTYNPATDRWVRRRSMLNPSQPIFGGPTMHPGWGQPSGRGGMGRSGGEDGSFGYSHPDAWLMGR
mgnify:CR=1 FL=1